MTRKLKRLKKLLPVATSNFLCCCHQLLLRKFESDHAPKHMTDVKVSAMSQERSELKIDISSRRFTVCFKHPRKRHYYISHTSNRFSKPIFKWLRAIHDCHLLHSKTLGATYTPFDSNVPQEVLYESDEEQNLEEIGICAPPSQSSSGFVSSFQNVDSSSDDNAKLYEYVMYSHTSKAL